MQAVEVKQGSSPVILGLPHTGTWLPERVRDDLNQTGRALSDTDWHVDRLYAGLLPDATTVRATFHRYLIDANRDPAGASLYPGQNTTGLVPVTDFDGNAIWTRPPEAADREARRQSYHAVYHTALENEMQRVRDCHGVAVLFDCHSIRSTIPFLFDGLLPDFNIGTNGGTTCDPGLETITKEICASASGYSSTVNGRFKGGWTTRHYGRPADGFHAIQMELAQSTYLKTETAPFHYDAMRAGRLRPILSDILHSLQDRAKDLT